MKRLFLSGAVLIISLFALVGCSGKYNAVLYSHADKLVSEEFLKENRVKAYYRNENYVEGVSDWKDRNIYEADAPEELIFIITDKDEFEKIFVKYDLTVDFEKEIVILYIFPDIYPGRDYYLKKIDLNEQSLDIYFKLQKIKGKDATMPYQRCFMVKLDKVEFKEVNFIEKR